MAKPKATIKTHKLTKKAKITMEETENVQTQEASIAKEISIDSVEELSSSAPGLIFMDKVDIKEEVVIEITQSESVKEKDDRIEKVIINLRKKLQSGTITDGEASELQRLLVL